MGKHKSGGGESQMNFHGGDDSKHEQKLQAVLFGDSFTHSFRPITLEKCMPKVLCPLNNVTLLDYCMEFLAGAGVQEIFVFCVHGAAQVEDYVQKSSWNSYIDVHCIRDSTCMTPGDALRELDKKSLIRSNPFLLMNGDVVTNINILPTIEAHKRRYKADSSAIMTMLFQRTGSNNLTNTTSVANYGSQALLTSLQHDLVVGLNPNPNEGDFRMVLYDDKPSNHKVTLPCDFFQTVGNSLELRTDLMPVGLDLCSPEVLSRFSDEFDYQDLYRQFVHESVLEEEEGLQSKVYAHVLREGEYGARAKDFKSYHAISRDVMRRWCYPPIGLDNLPSGYESHYRYATSRHYVYREILGGGGPSSSKVGTSVVGRSTKVVSDVILGANICVGEGCYLKGAVIGNNVTLGCGVKVVDSHIWDNSSIEDNVTVYASIIAQDCQLKQGSTVGRGCVLGKGCIVGENVRLADFTRLTACAKSDEADFEGDGFDDDDLFSSSSLEESISETSSSEQSDEEEADTFDNAKDVVMTNKLPSTATTDDFVSDHQVVGKDGYGRVWNPLIPKEDHEESEDESRASQSSDNMLSQSIGFDITALRLKRRQAQIKQEQEDLDEGHEDNFSEDEWEKADEEEYGTRQEFESRDSMNYQEEADDNLFDEFGDNTNTGMLPEDDMVKWGQQRGVDVVGEMKALCMEHEKSNNVSNLAIELNSFKFSQNASFADCSVAAMLAVLERMVQSLPPDAGPGKMALALQVELDYWVPLFVKFRQSSKEELSIIQATENCALWTPGSEVSEDSDLQKRLADMLSTEPGFRLVLQTLEDKEIVKDSTILLWAKDRHREIEINGRESPIAKLLFQKSTQDYLEWLAEESGSEEESDDDDEDDEEDDDEDDD